MKKRVVQGLFMLMMSMVLVACGTEEGNVSESNSDTAKETINNTEIETESDIVESQESETESWGVDENYITERNDAKAWVYIKFPSLCGIIEGCGKIAYQMDDTLVILGAENDFEEPTIEGDPIANIFPAYFQKVNGILEAYRGSRYKDFAFEIISQESLSVNDYEMCKYKGKHTFTYKGENVEMSFVAYATRLKANDAVVYWMVLDETDEQSLSELIESHADKMAKSLHE